MDISFSPSTKTKLKIALNPDFSDVPPDDARNNYNSKYPPYYDENRFFFTEDLDAFGVDYSMFYTRFIAQPQLAVKFTGNSKTLNYGYLCAKDKKIVDSDGEIINTDDFYQLASVIKSLPKFQMVLSSASRLNTGYYNHIGSVYWDWEFLKKLHFGTSHIFSIKHREYDSPEEDDDRTGSLFHTHLKANPGNWTLSTKYSSISQDLQVDMGTYYDTGYENYNLSASWNSDTKEQTLRSWGFYSGGGYSNRLDANKSFSYENVSLSTWFNFLSKLNLSGGGYKGREAYQGLEHDLFNLNIGCGLYKWDAFNFSTSTSIGKSLIYDINKTADYTEASLYFSGSVGQKMNWSLNLSDYQYDYNKSYYFEADSSTVYLDNHYQIVSAYLNYNFNNNMSIRNGASITTYDAYGAYSNLTFYSNYSYEFKKDWFLYFGYQTGQYQDEKSLYSNPMGHFVRDRVSAYLKLSVTM